MAQSVRVFFRKRLALGRLNFDQRVMYEIGQAGVFAVAERLAAGQGPSDGPAKPLKKSYAIYKSRKGKGNKRDLFFTGQMLRELKVRTVSANRATASVGATRRQDKRMIATTDKRYASKGLTHRYQNNKDVARANQEREPWLVFSPRNIRERVLPKAKELLGKMKDKLVRVN